MKKQVDVSKTLGFLINNPLNIRFNIRNCWLGQSGETNGFCKFKSVSYGLRAAVVLLRNYLRRGYNTPRAIITRFAPPSENHTDDYIKYVCSYLVQRNVPISYDEPICSIFSVQFPTLICAMAKYESGMDFFVPEIDEIIDQFEISD